MLAMDNVQRQVRRDAERVEYFRALDRISVDEFAQHVTALCQGMGHILAVDHLPDTSRSYGQRTI